MRSPAGQWTRPVLATHRVALGERVDTARGRAPELRTDRRLLRQLCPSTGRGDVGRRTSGSPDIDDTVDVVHGHQQLSLFNAHHDERCFMPIHVYDIATSRPVAILLRPGKTPSGHEVRCHVRRLVRRIRSHWPNTKVTIRGDGHYGRPEVMAWCEANAVDYIFGLPGNAVLSRLLDEAADDVRVRRAEAQAPVLRRYAEIRYGAKSWGCKRRVSARIEATTLGLDIRCVVTNLRTGSAEWLYDTLYCARGQAENLIKLHKSQLASDRTSCRSALANQVRLVLHTAAYWLMLTARDAIPKPQPLATAEFTTLRVRLLKIAGRITETATRVRIAFAAASPRSRVVPQRRAQPATRRAVTAGAAAPDPPHPINPNACHLRAEIALVRRFDQTCPAIRGATDLQHAE